LWLTLRPLFGLVAQSIAFRREGLHGGQDGIRGAFLRDKLAADFRGAEPGIEPRRAQLRVGLTLAIDERLDIGQQGGPVVFCTLTATGRKGIQTGETTRSLMGALADCHTAPAEFTFCAPLSP
jgi:hypothetical protein